MPGLYDAAWRNPDLPRPPPLVDSRPIPPGWVQSYDRVTNCYFYTDTNMRPYRSYWEHPGDCGYDPSIYGRRFTYDEVLEGRRHGYRLSHGFEWMKNLDRPPEAELRYRWRDHLRPSTNIPDDSSDDDDDDDGDLAGERQHRRRRTRRRRRGPGHPSYRPRSVPEGTTSEEEHSSAGESAAASSSTRRRSSTQATSLSGASDRRSRTNSRRTSRQMSRLSEEQTPDQHGEQPSEDSPRESSDQNRRESSDQNQRQSPERSPRQSRDHSPRQSPDRNQRQSQEQSQELSPQQSPERSPERNADQPPQQPPEEQRTYAASDLDYPNMPPGGIYLIPRVLNPWVEPSAPAPPPPYTSPEGSHMGIPPNFSRARGPDATPSEPSENSDDGERRNQPLDADTRFYINPNRGEDFNHRGRIPPRSPPASPTRVGYDGRTIRTTTTEYYDPSHADNHAVRTVVETEYTGDGRSQTQDYTQEPSSLMDRFRKILHLHVPTTAEKAAKKDFKKAQRAQKEAEISHRNQRRYEAAADRMKKQSELFNEMNRRETEIYQTQALKEKMGFNDEIFQRKIAEGTLMNGTNNSPSTVVAEAGGGDSVNPNEVAINTLDTSMPGNLRPSPNAPIGVAVDDDAETRRRRPPEDSNPNKLRTPAPSPPRYYGDGPQITSDSLWRRHKEDRKRAQGHFIRDYARDGDEIDPRYGAFGSGRFAAGSPAGIRWMMSNRGFERPRNRPSVFGGETSRHPAYFDYADYDEHEWDGGGGHHGASLNCAW
ncbi:hypothetical protein TWF281_004463 [Arthrobotrys megalospora]